MIGSSAKKILKIVGYPLFFLAVFLFFLLWTFPADRFAPVLESQLTSALGRKVDIGEMSISPTGDLVLSMVEIEMPKSKEDDPLFDDDEDGDEDGDGEQEGDGSKKEKEPEALTYLIEEAVVSVGFLGLLFDELDLSVHMEALGGEISVSYDGPMPGDEGSVEDRKKKVRDDRRKKRAKKRRAARKGAEEEEPGEEEDEEDEEEESSDKSLDLAVDVVGVKLARIHDLGQLSPLPVSGTVDMKLELKSSTGSFRDASGSMIFDASGVSFGNGRSKIDVGGLPMSVDEIAVDKMFFEVLVKEGVGEVERFEMASNDFDASVEGTITFWDPISRSRMDLYLMFRFLEGYANKSASSKTLISNLDTFSRDLKNAHRKDGYYGFKYRGVFGSAKMTPSKRNIKRKGKDKKAGASRPGRPSAAKKKRKDRVGKPAKTSERVKRDPLPSGRPGGEDPRDDRPGRVNDRPRPGMAAPLKPGARPPHLVEEEVVEAEEEEEVEEEEVAEETEEGHGDEQHEEEGNEGNHGEVEVEETEEE